MQKMQRLLHPVIPKEGSVMSEAMSNGPFCQRCGMPLEKPEDFGTAASGSASTTTVVGAMRVGFSPNRTFRWSR